MKIQIKHRYDGSILFEHECENNTIKNTLMQGIKAKANLRGCDLSYSNLSGCDLRNSNLRGCDLSNSDLSDSNLSNSNLRGCDLSYSNLSGCDLRNSNLRGCDLRNSNLSDSNLRGCDLSNSDLSGCAIPIFSKWTVTIINNEIIKIGCKSKTIEDWDLFFASTEEFETKRGTSEFKQIEAIYLAHKAYLTHLNE